MKSLKNIKQRNIENLIFLQELRLVKNEQETIYAVMKF